MAGESPDSIELGPSSGIGMNCCSMCDDMMAARYLCACGVCGACVLKRSCRPAARRAIADPGVCRVPKSFVEDAFGIDVKRRAIGELPRSSGLKGGPAVMWFKAD